MKLHAAYPTPQHATAAEVITRFFTSNYDVDAVMLVNSCARGKATRDSCLDINILVEPDALKAQIKALEAGWASLDESDASIQALKAAGKYSVVHLDFVDGVFTPYEQDEAAGPDWFEVSVGNLLAYSVPLWQGNNYLSQIKAQWLPYYNDELRTQRLTKVRWYCLNNLHHIPLYIERGLYFQSFDRLYNAYQEFLQALFITRRIYPIAYNKWIREQFDELLNEPALYEQLTHLFEIKHFESAEITDKAKEVEALLDQYAATLQKE
jgi:hypothetical protein